MQNTVLVVDDMEINREILTEILGEEYRVETAENGRMALEMIEKMQGILAVVLLDLMMPEIDGLEACMRIREFSNVPIIMLTARSEDTDKIIGFECGADDYITKPFNPLELTARVRTQLRRYTRYNTAAPQQEQTEKDIRGLHMDKDAHHCSLNGQEVVLTPIEFNILWYLCERQGSVVSSEELFEAVWGEKYLDNNNTVMAHIARIREKLKEPARRPKYIKTVWGVGYTIE